MSGGFYWCSQCWHRDLFKELCSQRIPDAISLVKKVGKAYFAKYNAEGRRSKAAVDVQ